MHVWSGQGSSSGSQKQTLLLWLVMQTREDSYLCYASQPAEEQLLGLLPGLIVRSWHSQLKRKQKE